MTAPRTLSEIYGTSAPKKRKSLSEIYGEAPAPQVQAPQLPEVTPDSYGDIFAKGMGKGISSIVTGPTELLGMAQEKLGLGDQVAGFAARLRENVAKSTDVNYDPDRSMNTQRNLNTAGQITGMILPSVATFGAADTAIGAGVVRSVMATRALDKIAIVAESALGKSVGGFVSKLPTAIPAGVAAQGLLEPESVSSTNGLALAAGFSVLGGFGKRIGGTASQAAKSNTALHPAMQEILEKVEVHDPLAGKDAGTIAKALKAGGIDQHSGIKDIKPFHQLPNFDNPAVLIESTSGSSARAEQMLTNKTFLIDKNGETIVTGKGLAEIIDPLKTKADQDAFTAVTFASHSLDEGMNIRQQEIFTTLQKELLGYPQTAVNDVHAYVRANPSATLKEVIAHLKGTSNAASFDQFANIYRTVHAIENVAEYSTNIKPQTAIDAINAAPAHVLKAVEEAASFRHRVLDYAVEVGGLMNRSAADDLIKLYPTYVSLERSFAKEATKAGKILQQLGSKVPAVFKQQFGGSKALFKDPIRTTTNWTTKLVRQADQNRVIMKMAEFAEANPNRQIIDITGQKAPNPDFIGDVFQLVDDATPSNSPQVYAIKDQLLDEAKKQGHKLTDTDALQIARTFMPEFVDDRNLVTFFQNGVLRRAKVSPEIATAVKSFHPQDTNFLVTILSAPARSLKAGVTASLDFVGFNFVADQFNVALRSKHGFRLGRDTMESLKAAYSSAPKYVEARADYVRGGGGFSGLRSGAEISDAQLYNDLLPKTKQQIVKNTFLHPIDALKKVTAPLEQGTRIAEFMLARKAGLDVVGAAMAGRRVSTDFAVVGAQMKGFSQMTAFLNPAIQSTVKDFESVGANPIKFAMKGVASISMPTAALWVAEHGDQEITDLRKSPAGSIYWHFRLPDGEIGRLRKPFLVGTVFANGMEAALDAFIDGDPKAGKQFIQAFKSQAGIGFVPNVLALGASLFANKDFHSGSPIVPTELEGVDKEFQSTEQTTTLAHTVSSVVRKVSGGVVNLSPVQMDYVFRATLGGLGENVIKQTDRLVPSENSGPEKTKSDWPLVGRLFARYPTQSVQPVRQFYDDLNKTQEVIKTAKFLERNKPEELAGYIENNAESFALSSIYTETKMQLADIRHKIKTIGAAPDDVLSPQEKRELIDDFTRQIIEITRAVNESVHPANPALLSQGPNLR